MEYAITALSGAIEDWRRCEPERNEDTEPRWRPLVEPEELVRPAPELASWPIRRTSVEEHRPA